MKKGQCIINARCYAPVGKETPHRRFTLTVECIADMVPGTWHDPLDLMRWISQHNYVQTVTLTEDSHA